jgi:hypothetical protein
MTEQQQRDILLASIAKAQEKEYTVESTDYRQVAKDLLGLTATEKDTATVESILNYIKKLPKYEELVKEARVQGMSIPAVEAVETFKTGSIGWMRRMINLIA